MWINDAGRRSYYCGLTIQVAVHIIVAYLHELGCTTRVVKTGVRGIDDERAGHACGLTMLVAAHIIVD